MGGADGNVSQKATDMKKDAEELLKKATNGMETLKSMCTAVLNLAESDTVSTPDAICVTHHYNDLFLMAFWCWAFGVASGADTV